jgi:hypothetical protein
MVGLRRCKTRYFGKMVSALAVERNHGSTSGRLGGAFDAVIEKQAGLEYQEAMHGCKVIPIWKIRITSHQF